MADGRNMTYFKVLDGLEPHHGGAGRYPGVGRWTKHIDGELEACRVGYHLAKDQQLFTWLGPTIYEAEPCPDHEPVDAGDKWVSCRVRLVRKLHWDDRIARRFAADCAEGALLGERARGREPDVRSWAAVVAARRFADGEISRQELTAAWAAAWDAAEAGDAAWAAAWDAAEAGDAAWAAAWAAAEAGDAARAAAWAAAWDAVRAAQYERLTAYLYGQPIPPAEALYGGVPK